MSTDETLNWLKNTVHLEEYEKPFCTNKIDGLMLAEMKEQALAKQINEQLNAEEEALLQKIKSLPLKEQQAMFEKLSVAD